MSSRARLVALLAAALVSGCASNVASSFNPGGVPQPILPPGSVKVVADGGLFISTTIALSATTANVLSGIFIVGFLAAGNDISPRLVTEHDYQLWRTSFGKVRPGGSNSAHRSNVPEPASWLMLAGVTLYISVRHASASQKR